MAVERGDVEPALADFARPEIQLTLPNPTRPPSTQVALELVWDLGRTLCVDAAVKLIEPAYDLGGSFLAVAVVLIDAVAISVEIVRHAPEASR